jgi:hypothetical protein
MIGRVNLGARDANVTQQMVVRVSQLLDRQPIPTDARQGLKSHEERQKEPEAGAKDIAAFTMSAHGDFLSGARTPASPKTTRWRSGADQAACHVSQLGRSFCRRFILIRKSNVFDCIQKIF